MKFIRGLLLATLVFGLTGCIEALIETDLHADGSGTFNLSYSMSPSVAEAMKELEGLKGTGGPDMPMFSKVDDAKIKKICKENGVTLKTLESTDTSLKMAGDFKSLDGLNAVMSQAIEGEDDGGFALFRTEDGNYLLQVVEAESSDSEDTEDAEEPEDFADEDAEEADPAAMMKAMEGMGKLMSSISELNLVMRFTVPGDIIESNAPKTEGRTSIWEINGENVMSMESAGEPEILFSGKGVKIDAPGIE